jgi:enoyl-CoA hydratase
MLYREDRNGLAIVRVENGKVNALDLELLVEFRECLANLRQDQIRGLVLTGAGSSFSAGVDLFRVLHGGTDYIARFLPALLAAFRDLFQFPHPVVAAVNGHAIAGGCVLVGACDYRIMAEGTGRIGVTELLVGVPFPALQLEIIRACVASQHFQSIVYSGRTYAPAEALAVGLIDQTVAPDSLLAQAVEAAERLAQISPRPFGLAKSQIGREALDRADRYAAENDAAVAAIWAAPETHQFIDSYLRRTIRQK